MIDDSTLGRLGIWLREHVGVAKIWRFLPEQHPALMWLNAYDEFTDRDFDILIKVLANGGHLPLLAAIVFLARAQSSEGLPPDVDIALGRALLQMDKELIRATNQEYSNQQPDIFVCYAHEDNIRVDLICKALRAAGLSVFRDTESIRPGESIAAKVAFAATAARVALVVVSEASKESKWVERETALLMLSRSAMALEIYPVVIDDVQIPEYIQDIFAIDLRDLKPTTDIGWIDKNLRPLIREIQIRGPK